jgi:hypothetical protein
MAQIASGVVPVAASQVWKEGDHCADRSVAWLHFGVHADRPKAMAPQDCGTAQSGRLGQADHGVTEWQTDPSDLRGPDSATCLTMCQADDLAK